MQYMCNAMDVPLPLLPFSGKAEYQLFAKMMLRNKGPVDEVKFAMEWCKYVDPKQNIHAKLRPTPLANMEYYWNFCFE